ncbi:response regulator [Paraglaciecola sp. L1A13]|uniref:response regulator n=1 Tax=Paraglaciecola sp. L1A13 TaxID=2686359 RepID=UPI00131BAD42|nr:response regulator [Paraglaciecola sp. L1A13]
MTVGSILIVDDSDIDQFILKFMIEKYDADITILQAYDGKEALDILQGLDSQPELIFLDINMPRMNGHEFLKVYESLPQHDSAVIMLSSSDEDSDKQQSLAYQSVKQYRTKPIAKADLEEIVCGANE